MSPVEGRRCTGGNISCVRDPYKIKGEHLVGGEAAASEGMGLVRDQ
jgi:hypothetical protein